jgi:multiple sugar transport system permease protein
MSTPAKRRRPGAIILTVVSVILAVAFLVPLLWSLAVSLKREGLPISTTFAWFAPPYTLENYPRVLFDSDVIIWVRNSLLVAVLSTGATLVFTPMAAYAIAKIRFIGNRVLYVFFLLGMMIPFEAMVVPLFITANALGLIDTYAGLVLPMVASSLNFIIMVAFIRGVPNELLEAARIDGAGYWRSYLHIILPLSRTILITVGIFSFIASWNNYLWPLLATMSADLFTLPIGIPQFAGTYTEDYVLPMTANMVASLPLIILFLIVERFIVKGVSLTGIKG